jgi:hypothetical protein
MARRRRARSDGFHTIATISRRGRRREPTAWRSVERDPAPAKDTFMRYPLWTQIVPPPPPPGNPPEPPTDPDAPIPIEEPPTPLPVPPNAPPEPIVAR